jgi:CHAT domain-containing protein
LFTGTQATEKNFKENISSKSIIHIASHGFFIPEDKRGVIPYYQDAKKTYNIDDDLFYSGLVFANGQESWNKSSFKLEANDGILTAYEISKLNLHKCDLVILSACETGKGNRSFDGIIGLERGFKTAGAKSVIMSLWKVDDVATSFMMESFYKELLKCGSIFSAFRTAQEIVREKYPDPYYWASFILLD